MSAIHKINIKHLAISLAISLGTGILAGLLTMGSMEQFEEISKPPLSPPGIVFPIVWFILYTLMGISSYIIYESQGENRTKALAVYAIQLVVNFIWPILFFNLDAYLLSFIWIMILWVLIIIMLIEFRKISKTAFWLQIPYLIWVTFAAYLNFGVFLLN